MGLRESLRDFFTMQEATAAGAQATGELAAQQEMMQKKQSLRDIAQQIPGALQSGDISGIAGQAYGIGDPSILREALGQSTEKIKAGAKPGDPGLKGESLRAAFPGMTPEWYGAAESATSREQQRQEFAALGSQVDRDADRSLRQQTQYEQSRDKFDKALDSKLKKYRENVEAFEKLQELDPYTNVGFWPQLTTIIKKVGMDAGALSDQDRNIFITATGQRTMTQALQYLGAIDPSKNNVPPETIKAVVDVISKMKGFSDKKFKERASQELATQAEIRGDRIPDDLYKEKALDLGLVASKKDGKWKFGDEITGKPKKLSVEGGSADELESIMQKLNPQQKSAVEANLKSYADAGKPVPQSYLNALKKAVGGN